MKDVQRGEPTNIQTYSQDKRKDLTGRNHENSLRTVKPVEFNTSKITKISQTLETDVMPPNEGTDI